MHNGLFLESPGNKKKKKVSGKNTLLLYKYRKPSTNELCDPSNLIVA